MSSLPYHQVPYQNQLQFNLGVPLLMQNLASKHHHPVPIVVERVGGQHVISGNRTIPTQKLQGSPLHANRSEANYSIISEDKMEIMTQLARRDLKNRAVQQQMVNKSQPKSSVKTLQASAANRAQSIQCRRVQQQPRRAVRHPLTVKEAEKNKRLGAVQTPPPHRTASFTRPAAGNDSAIAEKNISMNSTHESDIYFPVKPNIQPDSQTSDEIAKIQQELEGYLQLVEKIVERALSEGGTHFLHPPSQGRPRHGYLAEEEDFNRTKARVGEQNIRFARNLYNLRQKVKQLQREVAQADLNKIPKRNQISTQLAVIHRGAAKSMHTFVNQLPYQDLETSALPTHFHDLALLVKHLVALASLARVGGQSGAGEANQNGAGLLTLLEKIESLNSKWSAQIKQGQSKAVPKQVKKPVASKGWVSDTKVDKNIFAAKDWHVPSAVTSQPTKKAGGVRMQSKPKQQEAKRPAQQTLNRQRGRPPGKENRGDMIFKERREELRSGITALLQGKQPSEWEGPQSSAAPRPVAWEVQLNKKPQDHRKGYLLPSDLIAKREQAQRAVQASNQHEWHFAKSTKSAQLKTSLRPSSAPASPDKRVNFDLDNSPKPLPWMPAGRSPSSSRSSRSRSLSPERRSPFYVRDMDKQDIREAFSSRQSPQNNKKTEPELLDYGFRSLPTDKKLRSADVSNSFIDEVEHRLLARLMGQRAGGGSHEPMLEHRPTRGLDLTGNTSVTDLTDGEWDDTLDMSSPEEQIHREAVSLMDAPTLENVKLRLREMQREQREIRQRWSSLKFYDSEAKSRIFSASEMQTHEPREPPAMHLVSRQNQPTSTRNVSFSPINKEVVEVPLIFSKPAQNTRTLSYLHTVYPEKEVPLTVSSLQQRPKRLLSLKQTTAERIAADRTKFEGYLKRHSHHPAGKFDPWALMDEISEEILADCLKDVAHEVEGINEEIANHMYKSEFMVENSSGSPSTQFEVRKVGGTSQHSRSGVDKLSAGDDRTRVQAHVTPTRHQGLLGSQGDSQLLHGHQDGVGQTFPVTASTGQPSGHLWRSSPRSPDRDGHGSGSPTPRSPQVSFSGDLGRRRMSPSGGRSPTGVSRSPTRGIISPTNDRRSPTGATRSPTRGIISPTGDRRSPIASGVRSPLRGIMSPTADRRSPTAVRDGRQISPQVSASEPFLEDVSNLLPNRGDESSEEESGSTPSPKAEGSGPVMQEVGEEKRVDYVRGEEKSDKGDEDDEDDDDSDEDDDDYSEEDFEDESDVVY